MSFSRNWRGLAAIILEVYSEKNGTGYSNPTFHGLAILVGPLYNVRFLLPLSRRTTRSAGSIHVIRGPDLWRYRISRINAHLAV
jgi:hypothetical protein